jgi:phage shock protein PspC (stress-responsive transcriptional regulator)
MAPGLQRPPRGEGRVIAGVCAALAERFRLPRTLVRAGFVVFAFVGAGELAYLIGWVLIPTGPDRT